MSVMEKQRSKNIPTSGHLYDKMIKLLEDYLKEMCTEKSIKYMAKGARLEVRGFGINLEQATPTKERKQPWRMRHVLT